MSAHAPDEEVRIYWRPGCSSCARVKDFLLSHGIAFRSIDIVAEPDGMAFLSDLGIRSVPVVMRGGEFSFAQSLEDVGRFLSLPERFPKRLDPAELVERWRYFIGAARSLAAKVPENRWDHAPQPGLTVRGLAYHVFRIPVSFLACVEDGVADWVDVAMAPPPPSIEGGGLTAMADRVLVEIDRWWSGIEDRSCSWPVTKYDGVHSAHIFLERQVWHVAHHTRQIAATLETLGADVDGVIDPARYDGLPLPERVW